MIFKISFKIVLKANIRSPYYIISSIFLFVTTIDFIKVF